MFQLFTRNNKNDDLADKSDPTRSDKLHMHAVTSLKHLRQKLLSKDSGEENTECKKIIGTGRQPMHLLKIDCFIDSL